MGLCTSAAYTSLYLRINQHRLNRSARLSLLGALLPLLFHAFWKVRFELRGTDLLPAQPIVASHGRAVGESVRYSELEQGASQAARQPLCGRELPLEHILLRESDLSCFGGFSEIAVDRMLLQGLSIAMH